MCVTTFARRGARTAARHLAAPALALSVCAFTLLGQQTPPSATRIIRGVVFDSVANKPLAGALIEVAERGTTTVPRTATTDSAGRFVLEGIAPGYYMVGFVHDALTSLGLEAGTREVDLTNETSTVVNFAIPSSAVVRTIRCGEFSPFSPGMLVGSVHDAATHAAIPGAKATLEWKALALEGNNYRTITERSVASIDEDGAFVACRLPLDAALDLVVTAPGHRAVVGPLVTVPTSGIARLDVLLADSALTSGTAVLRGRVTRENGKPVPTGRVVIKELALDVPVQDGAFTAGNLPAGTWVAEARVIGVEPEAVLVTAADSAVATATIKVKNNTQRLEAVTVVGAPDRNTILLHDVLLRKRTSNATVFLPSSPALMSAHFTTDVMKEARGFSYGGPDRITGRKVALGGNRPCSGTAVYVNDMRQPDDWEGLDAVVNPKDVLAIEAYADISFAPVQYKGSLMGKLPSLGAPRRAQMTAGSPCAVVLIWTRL